MYPTKTRSIWGLGLTVGIAAVLLFLLLSFLTANVSAEKLSASANSEAGGAVVINEFTAKGTEWVELYNTSAVSITLTGWYLDDADCGSATSFIGAADIGPFGFFVVSSGDAGDNFSLDNSGDFAVLCDSGDVELDRVTFGDEGGAPIGPLASGGPQYSTARVTDGVDTNDDAQDWNIDNTPTMGAANDAPGVNLGGSAVVNEVDLFPVAGNDMVELYNPTGGIIDITGWFISDGDDVAMVSGTLTIAANGYLALEENVDWVSEGSTGVDFTTSDVVYLFDDSRVRVDQIGLNNGPFIDDSLQRVPDGNGPNDGYDRPSSGDPCTWRDLPRTLGATNNFAPDPAVSKTGAPIAAPGDTITYTVAYSNSQLSGDNAAGVVITDVLPAGVTYVSDTSGLTCSGCTPGGGGPLYWTAGSLDVCGGGSFVLTAAISASVSYGSVITNEVSIGATNGDFTATNSTAEWPTTISALDLTIDKEAPDYAISPGPLAYTITVNNIGVTTATDVIVTDTIPVSTTYLSSSGGYTVTQPVSGVVVLELGDLLSNTVASFNLTVMVDGGVSGGAVLTNTAEVSTATAGDNPANNIAVATSVAYPLVTIQEVQEVPDPSTDDASPLEGQVVWLEGVVTAAPGEIDNPSRLFVMEEPGGGPWSGIPVFRFSGFPGFAPVAGDYVRILGTVTEFNGLTEMNLGSGPYVTEIISTGNPIPGPDMLATSVFTTTSPNTAEQWEGVYIQFNDAVVTNDNLGFGEWAFDDGSGASRADDLGGNDGNLTYSPTDGDAYIYIRGIGWWSFGDYKLEPRFDADIALKNTTPEIVKDGPVLVAPGELYTYTITISNNLGFGLTGVVVTDVVPSNADFAYALDGGSEAGGVVSWPVGTLSSPGSVSVRFAVTATNVVTTILNSSYAVTATNFVTPTYGPPVGTAVGSEIRIHHIQGAAHFSPLFGKDVVDVYGIVTAVRFNGFYMQDTSPDSYIATSEGIFVFTGGSPGVTAGDEVEVDGAVSEFYPGGIGSGNLPTSQISADDVTVLSSGNPLPPPVVLGTGGRVPPNMVIEDDVNGTVETSGIFDPAADGLDFYESVEGMWVQVNDAIVVGSNQFGEIMVVGDNGANATGLNPRGGITIQPNDFNPERILIDDALFSAEPPVTVGDAFSGPVMGVIDYSFGNFKLLNPAALPSVVSGGLVSETAVLSGTFDQLTVASFNVLNLDPNPGDGDVDNFVGLAGQIVNNLNSPDVISLQEIQDNSGEIDDGVVDASATYNTLIAAITAAGGPIYEYRDIAPLNNQDGGVPGGNIRVGFLFRPDRVSFIDRVGGGPTISTTVSAGPTGVELSASPGRISPNDPAFDDSRKPLVGEFLFRGHKVFVVAAHFNSKGGDDPLFGRVQPPFLFSEIQRSMQAQAVNDFVDSILALDPDANVVVAGDLNDFQFSTPLSILAGGVLTDMVNTLPSAEQYSYIFDGNSQTLDHILVSGNLFVMGAAEYDSVHTNSEFSNSASDHDPQLLRVTLPPMTAGFTSNSPVIEGMLSVFTNTTTGPQPISYTWNFGDGSPVSNDENPTHTYATFGTYTVVMTAANLSESVVVTGTHVVLEALSASFTSNSPVVVGSTAVFTSSVSGVGPFTYNWDFGDGGMSSDPNPTHLYGAAGTYAVELTVSNASETVVVNGSFVVEEAVVYFPSVFKADAAQAAAGDGSGPLSMTLIWPGLFGLIVVPFGVIRRRKSG